MYFLRRRGMMTGPHGVNQLERMRASGHLMAEDQLSADRQVWVSAGDLLPALFGPIPPPVPAGKVAKSEPPPPPGRESSGKSGQWSYVDPVTRQRKGPVPVSDLATLARARQIKRSTLLWQAGMPDWIRADRALPHIFPASRFPWGIAALVLGLLAGTGLAAWLLYLALTAPTAPQDKAPAPGDFGAAEKQ
jgi:hypothetical protein